MGFTLVLGLKLMTDVATGAMEPGKPDWMEEIESIPGG